MPDPNFVSCTSTVPPQRRVLSRPARADPHRIVADVRDVRAARGHHARPVVEPTVAPAPGQPGGAEIAFTVDGPRRRPHARRVARD